MDSDRPFGQPWLDSCYGESILPDSPWHKVREKLCEGLAQKIGQQLNMESRRQVIFQLIGEDFQRQYFPTEAYDPAVLGPPKVQPAARKQLEKEGRNWLKLMINKVAAEVGCLQTDHGANDVPCHEMTDLLDHMHAMLTTGLNRRLYLTEQELNRQNLEAKWKLEKQSDAADRTRKQRKLLREEQLLRQSTGLRGILRNNRSPLAPSPRGDSPLKDGATKIGGARHQPGVEGPVPWGVVSNSLGRSVIALLMEDPRRLEKVVARLSGRQLPSSLRKHIWKEGLLFEEQKRYSEGNVEQKVRERFGLAVKRRVTALALRKATSSPVSTLINNDVLKVYSNSPGMRLHVNNTPHLVEAAKALNVLYVCSRTYESYLIYWLYPLQLAFPSETGQSEHVYELAMYLDLLSKTCFPSWPQIFMMAEHVVSRLAELDPELHRHLTRIAQIEALVDSNEFLVNLLQQEKAKSLLSDSPGSHTQYKMSKEILADPLVFIRRWIGEGFVSILDTQATIFVWDQFFLHRWRHLAVIEDLCLALLLLLKSLFMQAMNYTQMKWVFLGEPCLLYTSDIQRAWQGVQQKVGEVPNLNRRRSKLPDFVRQTSPPPDVATSVQRQPSPPPDVATSVRRQPSPPPDVSTSVQQQPQPVLEGLNDPFDLYVDAVTNIPDNATITKVTGRLFNCGNDLEEVDDILAFPVMDCTARQPRYAFRLPVNERGVSVSPNSLLLLRLYTIEAHTLKLVVVGNCFYEIFSEEGNLKEGGHCRQLYQGLPPDKENLFDLKQTSLDTFPRIPGCRIYFRLLPHTVDTQLCPSLQDRFFTMEAPNFNASEKKVVKSYERDIDFPKAVRDMTCHVQEMMPSTEPRDDDLTSWLRECLANKNDVTPTSLDLSRAVRYRVDVGVNVQILGASGLPEGLHFRCLARVSPGSREEPSGSEEDRGEEIVASTRVYNFDSLQTAPRWNDDETEMHPEHDEYACLIIHVVGVATQYKPHPSHKRPGKVTTKKGRELTTPDFTGWAVLPLFVDDCVYSGVHKFPVYEGTPTVDVLDQLSHLPPDSVLEGAVPFSQGRGDASIRVQTWDAHFRKDEQLVEMDYVDDSEDGDQHSRKVSAFILDALEKKYRKEGTSSDIYKKECEFYTEVVDDALQKIV